MTDINPIAEKFIEVANEYLEQHEGEVIDATLRQQLGELLMQATFDFVGVTESAEILGTSKQRVNQLMSRSMPPIAGRIAAGPFWLRGQIEKFRDTRESTRTRHLGYPKSRLKQMP